MTDYECCYCGRFGPAADDHIPARAFFVEPLPATLPTVKACPTCTAGAFEDDEYLRAVLRTVVRAGGPRPAHRTRAESLAAQRWPPPSRPRANPPHFALNEARLSRVAERYARGFFLRDFGFRVPADWRLLTVLDPAALASKHAVITGAFRTAPWRVVQPDVFAYAFVGPTPPAGSYGLLMEFSTVFPILVVLRLGPTPMDSAG